MVRKPKEISQPLNLANLFYTASEKFADNEALKYKVGHHYEQLTYQELREETLKLATVLKELGVQPGDKAIIFSENRPEWVVTDLALISLGCINVPIHSVLSSSQLEVIIKEIQPKVLFFSNRELGEKLVEISKTISTIPFVFSYEKPEKASIKGVKYFKTEISGQNVTATEADEIVEKAIKIEPKSLTTIIYTSGTTGHFKGVMLSHQNILFDVLAVVKWVHVFPTDRFFSILPLSHIFERTIGYYIPLLSGASIGYATDLAKVSQEIKERRPTIVIAVPRLFEKIYEKIMEKVNKSFLKKVIFRFAFGLKKNGQHKRLEKVFEKLVFSKVRAEFGGQIRFFVSGGAALPTKLGKFFDQVGLTILEGYGLTETSPVISCNRLEDYSFGTVGPVLDGIKVKISSNGEVIVKGPNVSQGYLKKSDTKSSFTSDGWFKTGDYGYFDRKGFLVITGRKKDLIVLSTGKKVSPTILESAIETSPYIDQAFVFGDARKHSGAIIVPNLEKMAEKFDSLNPHKTAKKEEIFDFLAEEMRELLKKFASYEKVHKFIVQPEKFTIENGELTPKLSLRRHVIYERNIEDIDKLY